jgi:hypothetical protein
MKTYICKDWSIILGEECGCEYREVAPGSWEFRYLGPGMGRTDWESITQRSLNEIRGLGHNPVEIT